MSLTPSQQLSHYRLVAKIGEGGMGVVWRATDSTLGRDVAVKVLPEAFAADPERLARLEREARLLASLNHPNIASIYGFHSADGVRFLAMELVEGDDLAQRLKQGPFPVDETVRLARQLAEALEHAHEKGIVHRDLKPANLKLTADGSLKVLDFGLARAFEGDPSVSGSQAMLTQSPTITNRLTGANVILGTAAYMSPEQARGQVADKRADIWAFGVVVLEMLTGNQLFGGDTVSDTLAAVLRADPDWSALPADTPPRLRRLLQRCLERDPRKRLRDIGEARILLEGSLDDAPVAAPAPAAPARASRAQTLLWGAIGLVVGGAAVALVLRASAPAVPTAPTLRFRLTNPPNLVITHPKLSPDGLSVAYLAGDHVMIQDLDQLEPRSLAQDADLRDVFWSPDGKDVGYIAGKKAVKVPRGGGETQVVSVTSRAFTGGSGGCWGDDGTLYFSHAESDGMLAVPAVGGDARVLFAPDSTKESDFHQPAALPGNRGILFVPHRNAAGPDAIEVWDGKARHVVFEAPGQRIDHPVYAPSGYLVFSRVPENPGIWAFPFSLDKLERTGEPFLVAALGQSPTVSDNGTLVYLEGSDVGQQQLVWVDGEGREIGTAGPPLRVATTMVDVSGDGNRVVLSTLDADQPDLSILDLARGTNSRLTVDDNVEYDAVWGPDLASVSYSVAPKGASLFSRWSIVRRLADGSGVPDTLALGFGPDPTPDGKMMVFSRPESQETIPIYVMSLEGDRTPRPLVRVKGWAIGARVSPDGRYLAYDSNESGRHEIYLKRFPDGEGRWLVSTGGGQWPHWNAKGDRLYYTNDRDIMEVEVTLGASPVLKPPKKLFTRPVLVGAGQGGWDPGFAVTADGSRFLVIRDVEGGPQPAAVVATNWAREFANRSGR